jgi:hypothetical protein
MAIVKLSEVGNVLRQEKIEEGVDSWLINVAVD